MADNGQPRYILACEKRLWIEEDGKSVEEVARRVHGSCSSTWDLLSDELDERVGVGRGMKLLRTAWLHLQTQW